MTTYNKLPYSNQFERGHSFNWAGKWKEGKYYYNNEYVTDFVVYENAILVCRKDHLSAKELEPELVITGGKISDVRSPYWEFIVASSGGDLFTIQNITYDESTKSIIIDYGDGKTDSFYLSITDTSINIGSVTPTDTEKLWLDTSNANNICLKININDEWKVVASSAACDTYITQSDLNNMFVTLTEEAYGQLENPNPNTYYFTYEEDDI